MEDPWLLLAVVASPRASLAYLQRALQVNPTSRRARAGMHWAAARARKSSAGSAAGQGKTPDASGNRGRAVPPTLARRWPAAAHPAAPMERRQIRALDFGLLLAMLALFFSVGLAYKAWEPVAGESVRGAFEDANRFAVGLVFTDTPTASPTPPATATSTAAPTATATDTPTPTATGTATPVPTDTPTITPTPPPTLTPTETPVPPTPRPTKRPKPKKVAGPEVRPGPVGQDENWIDVDLSSQTTYAMQGDQVVNSFTVSTGLWPNLTVTGVYRIYVKYRTADMYGADYYLSGVPYVMYFYKGYGLHGTYWHNNFGQPMSHGCVNLRPVDAGWLFDFAEVGTIVSVHE
jgi:lipoprotein-anchoring transpeptidase ErfK/SrfK